MDFQYRAAALEDLETLTRLRLEMRRERDGSPSGRPPWIFTAVSRHKGPEHAECLPEHVP